MVTRPLPFAAGRTRPRATLSDSPEPAQLTDFPGCEPVPMTWEEVVACERRIEYWSAMAGTAWILRDGGPVHESPVGILSEIVTRLSLERGSRVRLYQSVHLLERDRDGRPRQMMQADQTLYVHLGVGLPSGEAIVRGEDPLPEVILEVDHTTDVRRNKLALYQAWGFPELWVETPDEPSRSRPRRLRPGLTLYLLDEGRYRIADESRAFPGWKAASIHASLNETTLSPRTLAELTRVGRRLGRREGTSPEDDPQLASHRRQAHGAGVREGRAEGLASQRALVGRLASRRFDAATAERIVEALAGIEDPDRLTAAGDRIIDSADGRDLLSRPL